MIHRVRAEASDGREHPKRTKGRMGRGSRLRLLRFIAPGLLVAVALGQQALVGQRGVSPWKGAGFGMFATLDDPASRVMRGSVLVDGRSIELDLARLEDGEAGVLMRRARYVPTEAALRHVADVVRRTRWRLRAADQRAEPASPAEDGAAFDPVGGRLVLQVLTTHADGPPFEVVLGVVGTLEEDF
jgi:hypothetical protein